MNKFTVLSQERVASIRDIQKNPSAALKGITRVMRGSKTIGFFLSNEDYKDFLDEFGVMKPEFEQSLVEAHKQIRAGKVRKISSLADIG